MEAGKAFKEDIYPRRKAATQRYFRGEYEKVVDDGNKIELARTQEGVVDAPNTLESIDNVLGEAGVSKRVMATKGEKSAAGIKANLEPPKASKGANAADDFDFEEYYESVKDKLGNDAARGT